MKKKYHLLKISSPPNFTTTWGDSTHNELNNDFTDVETSYKSC